MKLLLVALGVGCSRAWDFNTMEPCEFQDSGNRDIPVQYCRDILVTLVAIDEAEKEFGCVYHFSGLRFKQDNQLAGEGYHCIDSVSPDRGSHDDSLMAEVFAKSEEEFIVHCVRDDESLGWYRPESYKNANPVNGILGSGSELAGPDPQPLVEQFVKSEASFEFRKLFCANHPEAVSAEVMGDHVVFKCTSSEDKDEPIQEIELKALQGFAGFPEAVPGQRELFFDPALAKSVCREFSRRQDLFFKRAINQNDLQPHGPN